MRNVLVYAGPRGRIWVAEPNGEHKRSVAVGSDPAVSPDGRYVAYDHQGKVRVIPTAGGRAATVTTGDVQTWAPNSRFLAVEDSSLRVVVVDVQTGEEMTSSGLDWDAFAFSPNSERIAYTIHGDLYVVPTRGGSSVRLTDDHRSGTMGVAWGKPGIAFFRYTHNVGWQGDIWLTDGRKHDARQLTHVGDVGDDTHDIRNGCEPRYFSASGRELLAQGSDAHSGWLCAVKLPSGNVQVLPDLGESEALGLSRDGTSVLAASCPVYQPLATLETIHFTPGKPDVVARHVPCSASWNR